MCQVILPMKIKSSFGKNNCIIHMRLTLVVGISYDTSKINFTEL